MCTESHTAPTPGVCMTGREAEMPKVKVKASRSEAVA